jgi:hypothetical protein
METKKKIQYHHDLQCHNMCVMGLPFIFFFALVIFLVIDSLYVIIVTHVNVAFFVVVCMCCKKKGLTRRSDMNPEKNGQIYGRG